MSYLLDGVLSDYPSFAHYFDALIVAAAKPSFFEQNKPLLELKGEELVPARLPLERGRIYQGGNLRDLQRALGVTGNRVLYVGDHIYGDMVRSKKDSAWRTVIIIPEMEAEIAGHDLVRDDLARTGELYNRRSALEDQLRHYQTRLKELTRNGTGNGMAAEAREGEALRVKRLLMAIRTQLRTLDRESHVLRRSVDQRFHPYWGSLLKEANELSLFGHQVSEYACVYTSRVSNLYAYSPHQYFRSPHHLMHHEL
jgi:hypothetical protein